jgi:hypothetical protein
MSVPSVTRITKLPFISGAGYGTTYTGFPSYSALMTIPYGSDYIVVAYNGIYRVGSNGTIQLFPASGTGIYATINFAKYIYPYELLFSYIASDGTYGLGILDLNGLQIQYKSFTPQPEFQGVYYLVPISDTDWILYTYNYVYYVSALDGTMNKLPITFKYAPFVSITKYIVTMDFDQNGNPYYTLYELDYKSGTLIKAMDIPNGLSLVSATAACTITPSTGPQFCDQSAAFALVDYNDQKYLMYYNIDTSSFDIMPLGAIDIPGGGVYSTYITPPFRHFKYQNIFVVNKYIIDVNLKRVYDVYDLINKQSPLDDGDVAEDYTMTVVQNPDSFQVAFLATRSPPQWPSMVI